MSGNIFGKVGHGLLGWYKQFSRWALRDANPATDQQPSYERCLNCGAELRGMYCHRCGQYATPPTRRMNEFIKEYFRTAFAFDTQVFPTLFNMIFHPGRAAREFSAGRQASYVHPLKLNFFLLLIMITLFLIAGTETRIKGTMGEIVHNDSFNAGFVLSAIAEDEAYYAKLMSGPREEVRLIVHLHYVQDRHYDTDYIEVLDVIGVDEQTYNDTLWVRVPSQLIADGYLVPDGENYVIKHKRQEEEELQDMIRAMSDMWATFTSFVFKNFPLFVLLTTPFLAFALRLVVRRRKDANYPTGHYFTFSLYYLAFVEILFLIPYLLAQFVELPNITLWFLLAVSWYLAVAIREAFSVKSWFRSVCSALIVNAIYIACCLAVIFVIVVVLLVYYALQYV